MLGERCLFVSQRCALPTKQCKTQDRSMVWCVLEVECGLKMAIRTIFKSTPKATLTPPNKASKLGGLNSPLELRPNNDK